MCEEFDEKAQKNAIYAEISCTGWPNILSIIWCSIQYYWENKSIQNEREREREKK